MRLSDWLRRAYTEHGIPLSRLAHLASECEGSEGRETCGNTVAFNESLTKAKAPSKSKKEI